MIKWFYILAVSLFFYVALPAYEYQLSICAIFQNESRFMKEWIEYHRKVGVEHFWLYNNLSNDDYQIILKPYIESGIVDLIEWNFPSDNADHWYNLCQLPAYANTLTRSNGISNWVAFIDLDEYLVPMKHDNLIDLLQDYQEFGGIAANWIIYGTSNIWDVPQDKMLSYLLYRRVLNSEKHLTIKSIVQPEKVAYLNNPHFFFYKDDYFCVNTNKEIVNGPFSQTVVADKIRCNHYAFRDMNYFLNIKLERQRKYVGISNEEVIQIEKNLCNEEFDDCILRFISQL